MQPVQQSFPPSPPVKKGLATGCVIALIVLAVLVVIGSILAVLAVYGTRKYIQQAKTAEARMSVGQLARGAVQAYENDDENPGMHRVCPSASAPVPVSRALVSGKKYQSAADDWKIDTAAKAGFACLRFELTEPQYFQYEYTATKDSFSAQAHGDLDGNGKFSTFELTGQVTGTSLVVAPALREVDPGE